MRTVVANQNLNKYDRFGEIEMQVGVFWGWYCSKGKKWHIWKPVQLGVNNRK